MRRSAQVVRPPSGPSRRQARARRRRRKGVVAGAAVLLLAAGVAAPFLVREGWRKLSPAGPGGAPISEPDTLLLAWPVVEDGGEGQGRAALVLLGAAPDTPRGAALLIPGRTQVEVPSFGSETLGTVLSTAGAGTAGLALENALGFDVGTTLRFDAATLAALFEPTAPFPVRLRAGVEVGDRSFRAGEQRLSAADAALLATTAPAEDSELDHLVVVHAVLEGWLAGLDADAFGLTQEQLVGGVGVSDAEALRVLDVLDAVSRRRVTFDTLDVASMSLLDEERYTIDEDAAREEMADLFAGLAFVPQGERVRVEILNGTGRAGLATEVAGRLIPAGARVVLTGNAARFGIEETLIVLNDARFEAHGRRIAEALGVGEVRMARDPIGVADVSVVVGSDFDTGGR